MGILQIIASAFLTVVSIWMWLLTRKLLKDNNILLGRIDALEHLRRKYSDEIYELRKEIKQLKNK